MSRELAEMLGVSPRTVSRRAKAGDLSHETDAEGRYLFDPDVAVAEWREYEARKRSGSVSDWGEERVKQDALIKTAKAEMLRLELDEMAGKLHRSEYIRDAWTDAFLAWRSHLMALPGKLAPELADGKEQTAEFARAIEEECRAICDDMAKYDYDPGYYRRRLKEDGAFVPGDDDG